MIINGGARGAVGWWSNHLMRDDTNERAEVKEIYGLLSENLPSALREMQAIAAQSRCEGDFMYVADLNPRDNERLTEGQWREAIDTLEKNMGLEGHQRLVVEHEKEGRVHRHVVWNRVDVETLRVADIGFNYYTHERTARELEERFGLAHTPSLHGERRPDGRPERAPELWEYRAEDKSGISRADLKAELTDLWRSTDSGQAFAAALGDRGYILARGDSRAFCVVDHAGDVHSLARRLDGVKTKDVAARLSGIDRDSLPSIDEAKAAQWERERIAQPLGKAAGEIRLAVALSANAGELSASLEAQGFSLARVDGREAEASQRANAFAKAVGNYAPRYDEGELVVINNFGSVIKLDAHTTGLQADERGKCLATVDAATLMNVTDTRAALKEAARVEFYEQRHNSRPMTPIEEKIDELQRGAATAGAFGAALYREGITISRADAAGIAELAADQRAAFQDDKMIYAPTLQEGELVAVSRFGGVHRLNPFKLDMDGIELALTAGNKTIAPLGYVREEIAADLSAEQVAYEKHGAEFWQGVEQWRDERQEHQQEAWRDVRDEHVSRTNDPTPVDAALGVVDAATGAVEKLADFVLGLLGGGSQPKPKIPQNQADEIISQRKATAALERIRDSMGRGDALASEDVMALTPSHLENIRWKGDAYIQQLIERMEQDRTRQQDYGRERER